MEEYQRLILHLTLINDVGPALIEKIGFQRLQDTASEFYHYGLADLYAMGLTQRQAHIVYDGLRNTKKLEQELMLIERHNASLVSILDDTYPALLRNIHLPPPILYVWGKLLSDHEHHIALVGSRKADYYTHHIVDEIVPPLIASSWVTVSGGARGADSIVHEKTLALGGRTIVVVGAGLLRPYPPENQNLFERIRANSGSIVSIFPMKTPPLAHHFPARNRVIAGLSRGTLVLQAARKSGALITASFALEQGREVGAVPGNMSDELSQGPHDLIKQGAHLVTSAQDIFDLFQFSPAEACHIPQFSHKIDELQDGPYKTIIDVCHEPRTLQELMDTCSLDQDLLHQILFDLQCEGRLSQNHAGLWQRVSM